MRKTLGKTMAIIGIVGCLCINTGNAKAIDVDPAVIPYNVTEAETVSIMRATGYFSADVKPYARAKGDTDLPLEAGETVRIRATYSPEDASVDFGLVGPDGVFYYVGAEDGSFDTTFEIPERGNYRLGIKNNSGQTVKVSGFITY